VELEIQYLGLAQAESSFQLAILERASEAASSCSSRGTTI
jgi:hypothetical protein